MPVDPHISLREYVDVRIDAQEKAVQTALTSAKEAVIMAEIATERRFENSNEWRNTVETLQRTYMPRTESTQMHGATTEKIDALQKLVWIGMGLLGACQFFVSIAIVVWKKS